MGDGWTWVSRDLEHSADLAREGWEEVKRRIADETYELLVLDEFTYPMSFGWVDAGEVVEVLKGRPGFQHVVVTGRDAPAALVDAADLVTEMRKVKHPYDQGIRGQQGIEW
jgi:cob(I)alamin adenosyltransferase